MFQIFTSSIRYKISAIILVAVISAVLISSVTSALQQSSRQFTVKQGEIEAIAAAMATTIAMPVATGDRRAVAATLSAISRISSLTYAAARDAKGRLLFQHGTGIVMHRDLAVDTPTQAVSPFSALYLQTYVTQTPIVNGGRRIGTLTLIADLSSLRHSLFESLRISLVFGAFACAVGIAAATFLQKTITDPIQALTRTMMEVRDTKNYNSSASRQSRDEIGAMVDVFNDMLVQIRKRDLALTQHREQLEATVEERTSELRVAKVAAEQANAAKSEFLATMSHEIRTPMNSMLVMAELLSNSNLRPRLRRYAEVIVRSGNGLLAIINDILDFSKIEAGKLELESIPVDPRRLIDDTLQLFHERASSTKLEIAAYVSPDVPRLIAADPVRLGQVLNNLVSNALKFTRSGGVLISLESASGAGGAGTEAQLTFRVRDTGIGIPEEKLVTIFDAFAQADQATTREFGGTGIGLAICRRLVGAMNGEIKVESAVDEGSTFLFEVPFNVVEAALPRPRRSKLSARHAVVDLEAGLMRDALVKALDDWNIEVVPGAEIDSLEAMDVVFYEVAKMCVDADAPMPALIDGPRAIAIGQFGDTRGGKLLEAGLASRVLDRPVGTIELAQLLRDLVENTNLQRGEQGADVAKSEMPAAPSFAGIRILAADDSALNQEVLREVLKRFDVHMTAVKDGLEAVEAAQSGKFDLIFMDGSMPRLDGYEATRRIREWESEMGATPMPIIALTAQVFGGDDRWCSAGMSDFVSKPFTLNAIKACLTKWLTVERAPTPLAEPSVAAGGECGSGKSEIALLDPAVLQEIREIQAPGDNLVGRVIGLYLAHAPKAFERLENVHKLGGAKEIVEAAHALKSLSRNVGALRVGDIAGHIEDEARSGNAGAAAVQIEVLRQALDETVAALAGADELKAVA